MPRLKRKECNPEKLDDDDADKQGGSLKRNKRSENEIKKGAHQTIPITLRNSNPNSHRVYDGELELHKSQKNEDMSMDIEREPRSEGRKSNNFM